MLQHHSCRFGNWTNQECWTEECVEAHTNVDVIVDVEAVRALLRSRLPLVFAGKRPEETALPWPSSDDYQLTGT